MGIDMTTMGSNLEFTTDEKTVLIQASMKLVRGPLGDIDFNMEDIHQAMTLNELFAAFRQAPVRDEQGKVIATFGYDDRYIDILPLMQALAPFLTDLSWVLTENDHGMQGFTIMHGQVIHEFWNPDTFDMSMDEARDFVLAGYDEVKPNRTPAVEYNAKPAYYWGLLEN